MEFPAYFGGFNNGKTFGLCIRAWINSLKYPDNRGVLCRSLVKELRDTTRHEFFKIVGCNETTIRNHPWVDRWAMDENMLRLKNGSEIYFRHLQDEAALASLLSLSIRWFGIDQAEEVHEAAFLTLIGRIGRTDIDGATGKKLPPPWGAIVGNPMGHNWIWKRWKKNGGLDKDYHLWEATTMEGPLTSKRYIERLLKNYPSHWIQRFVYGSWDVFKGQIYDEFDSNVHLIDPFPIPDIWKAGIGVDLGYNHPTAFNWHAVDYEGNWYVYDEHVASEKLPDWHAKEVKRKGITRSDGSPLAVYAPHDAMNRNAITGINLQQAYADEGIGMLAGNKLHPSIGIQRIKQMLQIRKDIKHPFTGKMGAPRCYVFKNCEHLIEEIPLYRWKELKPGEEKEKDSPDDVVKVNDDCVDAWRAWAMGWSSRGVPERPRKKGTEELDLESFIAQDMEEDMDYDFELFNI